MPKAADNSVKAVGSSYLLGTGWHSKLTHLNFAPESPEWFAWLANLPSFRFESKQGKYTARKEPREQYGDYWIAYVKHYKKLYKKYLDPTEKLTIARLEAVAEELTKQCENASSSESLKEPPASVRSWCRPRKDDPRW